MIQFQNSRIFTSGMIPAGIISLPGLVSLQLISQVLSLNRRSDGVGSAVVQWDLKSSCFHQPFANELLEMLKLILLFGGLFCQSIGLHLSNSRLRLRRDDDSIAINDNLDLRTQIFCNAELNGDYIEAVGFDMDFTLAQVSWQLYPHLVASCHS